MKKIFAAALVLMFVGTASVGFGAKLKCEVTGVDGDTVTMTCEKADKLKAGDKVRVDPPKGAAVEGC